MHYNNGYKIVSESIGHPLDDLLNKPDSYKLKVRNCLWSIFEDTEGISEKDFKGQDDLKDKCEGIIKDPDVEIIIERFETDKLRPQYCAECIYAKLKL